MVLILGGFLFELRAWNENVNPSINAECPMSHISRCKCSSLAPPVPSNAPGDQIGIRCYADRLQPQGIDPIWVRAREYSRPFTRKMLSVSGFVIFAAYFVRLLFPKCGLINTAHAKLQRQREPSQRNANMRASIVCDWSVAVRNQGTDEPSLSFTLLPFATQACLLWGEF